MTLANQYGQFVTPLLINAFNETMCLWFCSMAVPDLTSYDFEIANPATTLSAIIQKEAVYCAIGRCAHRVKDSLPFDQWLDIAAVEIKSTNTELVPPLDISFVWAKIIILLVTAT